MELAGRSNRIAGKNTRQTQAKINANAGKNTRIIAGKKTCNSTQNYVQFACEFTLGVIAEMYAPQKSQVEVKVELQVILPAIVRVFFPEFAVIFACVWRVYLPAVLAFLPASCMCFCLQKQAILHASRVQFCMSSACKTTYKMHVVLR